LVFEGPANTKVIRTLTVGIWLLVLTQKLALPGNIEVSILVMWGTIGWLFVQKQAVISVSRFGAFAALVFMIVITQLLVNGGFSLDAVLISVPLYAALVFVIPMSNRDYLLFLKNCQDIGLYAAILTLLQWITQAAHLGMLDLEKILPSNALYTYYNYMQPVNWGSPWFQPNGVFFLEASFACQFVAIALIVEVFIFQRIARIGVLAIAMLSTLAGTGVLMTLLMVPFAFKIINRRTLAAGLVLAPFGLAFLIYFGVGDYLLGRTQEFGVVHSSGYGRFIQPFTILAPLYDRNPLGSIIAGLGPGNIYLPNGFTSQLTLNPVSKLIAEYGWLVALLWMGYIHMPVIRSNTPYYILVPVLLQFNFMNGSLLMPIEVAYLVLLVGSIRLPSRLRYRDLLSLRRSIMSSARPVRVEMPAIRGSL
jgi:hypothetical protein